jgi:hypothetical protein
MRLTLQSTKKLNISSFRVRIKSAGIQAPGGLRRLRRAGIILIEILEQLADYISQENQQYRPE